MTRASFPLIAATSLLFATAATAQSFRQAFDTARASEPTYLGAKSGVTIAQEKSNQAFAGLLPQLTVSAATHRNHRDYHSRDALTPPAQDLYNSNNRQLNLTQPLWRGANFAATDQAEAVITQARYQLAATEQELLARLVGAWFDAMQARDNLNHASRQAAAARRQLEILQRGAELGASSGPALEEARAKYEQSVAEQVNAEMDLNVKNAALEQITGPLASFVPPFLSPRRRFPDPDGRSLDQWLQIIEAGNPALRAAEQALLAASEEIRKQRAGHQPTLDLVGSYGYNAQSVGNFPGQSGYDIKQGVIGLQLSLPIYSGGGQNAKVGEAVAVHEKARHELEATRRAVRLAAKQAWFLRQSGRAREPAARQAVKSSLLAIQLAASGGNAGLRTELDLLQARQQLEGARRDLLRARYDQLVAAVRLKAAAGQLTDADVLAVDALFEASEGDARDIAAD